MTWERCGNTPYYRRQSGGGTSYVNPFDWSHISVAVERDNDWEGSASILYRKAPRYDFPILKDGAKEVFDGGDIEKILRSTHGWFSDLIRAKELKLPLHELRRIFQGAPEDERANVLEGVIGLLAGYDNKAFKNVFNNPLKSPTKEDENTAITLIAVGKDTPAYRDIGHMKEFFDYSKRFFVADTLDLAIEEALGSLGIYEC